MRYAIEVVDGVNLLSGSSPLPIEAIQPVINWDEMIVVPWFFLKIVSGAVTVKTVQEQQDYLDANPPEIEDVFPKFEIAHAVDAVKTTGTSWVVKCSLTTAVLPESVYRIGWTFAYKVESKDEALKPAFRAILRLNNTKNFREIKIQPTVGANAIPITGFTYWKLSEVNTITLEFRRVGDEGTVTVSDAILEFWRASNHADVAPIKTGSEDLIKLSTEGVSFRRIEL